MIGLCGRERSMSVLSWVAQLRFDLVLTSGGGSSRPVVERSGHGRTAITLWSRPTYLTGLQQHN
jgi:hypothetical protein